MAKCTPVSSSNASPSDHFSDMSVQGKSGFVAFPATMAKEIERLTRDAGSPAHKALNNLSKLSPGDAPVGRSIGAGVYFLSLGGAHKDVKGFVYLPPDAKKDMPTTILTTMTYGEFVGMSQRRTGMSQLKTEVDALRSLYPDRKAEAKTGEFKKILKTHKVYSVALGIA